MGVAHEVVCSEWVLAKGLFTCAILHTKPSPAYPTWVFSCVMLRQNTCTHKSHQGTKTVFVLLATLSKYRTLAPCEDGTLLLFPFPSPLRTLLDVCVSTVNTLTNRVLCLLSGYSEYKLFYCCPVSFDWHWSGLLYGAQVSRHWQR